MDIIRREVEICDNFQGFQMNHSVMGGTGSGFGSLLTEKLRNEYPDRMIKRKQKLFILYFSRINHHI